VGLGVPAAIAQVGEPGERAEAHIEAKVGDGTITEARADEIRARLAERMAAHQAKAEALGEQRQALADRLGLTVDEMRAALRGGASVADLADEAGVDVDVLIDELVDAATARIEEAVSADRLDADQAAERLDGLRDRVAARVNGERPEPAERGHHPGRMGPPRFNHRFGDLPTDLTVDELAERLGERLGDRELPDGMTLEDLAQRMLDRRDHRAGGGD
jgi:hypothetical protein